MKADFVLKKSIVLCYSSKLLTINSPRFYFLCTNNLNTALIICSYHPPRSHWTHQLSNLTSIKAMCLSQLAQVGDTKSL
jgi:hypothetical protein